MKSIYEFKKGDVITRVEPSKTLGKGGFFSDEGFQDRSYVGDKLIFVGIANGNIYCKRTCPFELKILGEGLVDMALDIFSDGWDYYIDPKKLLEGVDDVIIISKDGIQEAIDKAIIDENYEAAARLEKLLNKEVNKNNEERKK